MSTEAQIRANRLNSQKSTGPHTSEGKAAVSQNAVKHGLLARQTVISSESQADFDLYRQQMLAELAPASPMESMLAERIVSLSWRLKRAGRIQNQTIDALNARNTSSPLTKLTKSLLFKGQDPPQEHPSESAAHLTLGRLAIKDFANARVLDRLLMYERRIEHSLYRTILELQRLNLIRKLDTASEMPFNQLTNQPTTIEGPSPVVEVEIEDPAPFDGVRPLDGTGSGIRCAESPAAASVPRFNPSFTDSYRIRKPQPPTSLNKPQRSVALPH